MNDRHQIAPYPVRLPTDLREKLEASAKAGARSLHAELIARLQASFAAATFDQSTANELSRLVNLAIDERIARDAERASKHSKKAKA